MVDLPRRSLLAGMAALGASAFSAFSFLSFLGLEPPALPEPITASLPPTSTVSSSADVLCAALSSSDAAMYRAKRAGGDRVADAGVDLVHHRPRVVEGVLDGGAHLVGGHGYPVVHVTAAQVKRVLADLLDRHAVHENTHRVQPQALAQALGTGFVPVRKPGKLPARTLQHDYALEYGRDRLEIHVDAVPAGASVVLVDDVLATGGTLAAGLALARTQGAHVLGAAVLVELPALGGRARWPADVPLHVAPTA